MPAHDETLGTYQGFYAGSVADPQRFWAQQSKLVDWHKPPQTIRRHDLSQRVGPVWQFRVGVFGQAGRQSELFASLDGQLEFSIEWPCGTGARRSRHFAFVHRVRQSGQERDLGRLNLVG